jgi:hypothetical protein
LVKRSTQTCQAVSEDPFGNRSAVGVGHRELAADVDADAEADCEADALSDVEIPIIAAKEPLLSASALIRFDPLVEPAFVESSAPESESSPRPPERFRFGPDRVLPDLLAVFFGRDLPAFRLAACFPRFRALAFIRSSAGTGLTYPSDANSAKTSFNCANFADRVSHALSTVSPKSDDSRFLF